MLLPLSSRSVFIHRIMRTDVPEAVDIVPSIFMVSEYSPYLRARIAVAAGVSKGAMLTETGQRVSKEDSSLLLLDGFA